MVIPSHQTVIPEIFYRGSILSFVFWIPIFMGMTFSFCHHQLDWGSRLSFPWIPAFAGMTENMGMTKENTGMTKKVVGMTFSTPFKKCCIDALVLKIRSLRVTHPNSHSESAYFAHVLRNLCILHFKKRRPFVACKNAPQGDGLGSFPNSFIGDPEGNLSSSTPLSHSERSEESPHLIFSV